jgi:DNA-binding response OmpR family regulator
MSDEHIPGTVAVARPALILVVEDDPSVRRMIQWALEDEGLTVVVAADGQQAVEWTMRRRPDLVLLDMGLPVVDGDGVASHIRDQYGATVPIVVVTADGRAAAKASRVGAVSFLQKPFEIAMLMESVRSALGPAWEV